MLSLSLALFGSLLLATGSYAQEPQAGRPEDHRRV